MPLFPTINKYVRPGEQSDADRAAQFSALVEIIRTEIRVGVDPIRGDIATLKQAVDEVRRAQQMVYTREVMDLKLKERDDAISEVEKDLLALKEDYEEFRKTMGSFWITTLTRLGAAAGSLTALFYLWQLLHL